MNHWMLLLVTRLGPGLAVVMLLVYALYANRIYAAAWTAVAN